MRGRDDSISSISSISGSDRAGECIKRGRGSDVDVTNRHGDTLPLPTPTLTAAI